MMGFDLNISKQILIWNNINIPMNKQCFDEEPEEKVSRKQDLCILNS